MLSFKLVCLDAGAPSRLPKPGDSHAPRKPSKPGERNRRPAPEPEPRRPAPRKPAPQKPAPAPQKPRHPHPPHSEPPRSEGGRRTNRDRLDDIDRATAKADKVANRARETLHNVGYQVELGHYAQKRGVFPKQLIPYLTDRVDGVSTGSVDRAAKAAVFASIQAYEGVRGGRNVVYQGIRAAIDHVADDKCLIGEQADFLRKSIKALDAASRREPPCPCGCADGKHAKAEPSKTKKRAA